MTDYHCHVLPRMDDGAKDLDMSLDMIFMMTAQGVDRIVATPHFYAHREDGGVPAFLERRQAAFRLIADTEITMPYLYLGAEVAVEQGISRLPGVHRLSIADTPYILLELPYAPFANWMLEEIDGISQRYGLIPVIAHIHRYARFYTRAQMSAVLRTESVFQFNNEAFRDARERRLVTSLIQRGCPYVFGSDAHNTTSRRPDWDFLKRKVRADIIDRQENLFQGVKTP